MDTTALTPTLAEGATRSEGVAPNRDYPDEVKIAALTAYAECGSVRQAAQRVGVSENTVRNWLNYDWAEEYIVQLRQSLREAFANDLMELTAGFISQMRDRQRYGDAHVTAKGDLIYAPVKARDCVIGMAVCMDKWIALTGTAPGQRKVDKQLAALSAKLLSQYQTPCEAEGPNLDGAQHLG